MKERNEDTLRQIHEAIHQTDCRTVRIGKRDYPIKEHPLTHVRYVTTGAYTVMEQDPKSKSSFGERARHGEDLSWVIPKNPGPGENWTLIEGQHLAR